MGLGGHGDDDTEKSCVVGVFVKSRDTKCQRLIPGSMHGTH